MRNSRKALVAGLMALFAFVSVSTVMAQITTGTVAGTVQDTTGGVIPGATVVLVSESRNIRSVPAVTSGTGDYVFPNITPDTYTVEVTMQGFRMTRRAGVVVSGGTRVTVPALVIEPGGATETVNVTAEAPLIQAQSGERSFAVTTAQIENLPLSGGRNFVNMIQLVPGVVLGGAAAGGTRIGGGGQNNIMMDGISAMDTGNNGQMLNMNIESIGEVKVLTQGYQAEYGRSSGLQITAVTKSGTNRFHGSVYDIEDNSDWNANSWANVKNGDAKTVNKNRTWGYTIGGPAGKPGGNNKLFFFYSHEYRPTKTGGAINRFRVPTALERQGNFSQSLDNNGNLFVPTIRDAAGNVISNANGIVPANRLYQVGINLLNRYPLPSLTQAPGTAYNLEIARPTDKNLLQQPAVRIDYQVSSALRFTAKYSGQRETRRVIEGTMPGFNDVLTPYPYITNYGLTVNYTFNPTTFLEGTYGFIRNELAGGGSGGLLVNPIASMSHSSLAGLPLLYPNAGVIDNKGYYAYEVMQAENPVFWDSASNRLTVPPNFAWGSRIGNQPPNQQYPGWLNINRTQDVAVSLTKVAGRHTLKAGFYNNHSFKAQNTGAGGVANLSPFGYINFGNDTNNPIDSGFGYANAAMGIFSQYLQQAKFVEGSMVYDNTEFYVQDNWKFNGRLTFDYGMRFTRQQPQHDQFQQMSNFFPEQWSLASAPLLYVNGCVNNAATCTGQNRVARNPVTGALLGAGSSAAVGTVIPGSGNLNNGIRQAGDGIAKTGYVWPTLVFGPRFGAAYDVTGTQSLVLRGGLGLFYDRPDGNTVFSIPTNPPVTSSQDVRNGTLQNLGAGGLTGTPAMVIFQYDAKVPASTQWNIGAQMALPWASSLDVSYVGQHGWNRLGAFQGGTTVNLNAVDFGAAYLASNQDTTLAASTVPGQNARVDTLLRPFRGLSNINQNATEFWETSHSIQSSFQRRFSRGFSFGLNYAYTLSYTGNTGLQRRLQHAADGTISLRADQAQYEELNKNLATLPHVLRGNFVWDLPDVSADGGARKAIGAIVNDWQLSGIWTAGSGANYDLGYGYNNNGANRNMTGSPDYGARIVYVGDPGSGCRGADSQYAQFNVASVTGPTYNSVGLESGRNLLRGCADNTWDMALVRTVRLGGGRSFQIRGDVFNVFNRVTINGRDTTITYDNPVTKIQQDNQFNADGSLNQARLTPRNSGFGAATSAQALRSVRVQVRFGF